MRDFRQFSDSTPSDLAPRMGLTVAPKIDGTLARTSVTLDHYLCATCRSAPHGNSALHFAAQRGVPEVVALLKRFGANDTIKNSAGNTPAEVLQAAPAPAAPGPAAG